MNTPTTSTPTIGVETTSETDAIITVTQALVDLTAWDIRGNQYDAHNKAEDIVEDAFKDAAIIIVPEWLQRAEDLDETIITLPVDASEDAVKIHEPDAVASTNPDDWTKWLPLSEIALIWNGEQYINNG